ncbi:type VI secretion protein [Roseibium aquae]|uniref:Type VI secretion protein n=1 Tax=Roseibium aquae TaxID=1323746 RepID=A0A916TI06_9HYPH|nr:type VI secretion system baseplate subunit TssG [Roseibium aquae]GGB45939.1 type VI secretion protein [Roseibium aquae]
MTVQGQPETLEDVDRAASMALSHHLAQSQFFQMVHLIGLIHADLSQMGPGHDPAGEPVRFRATRSLSFGRSDVSQVVYDAGANRFEIRVNFMGLYGPASPMPPYLTERIIERDEAPSSLEDLLDIFNHRLITLLYRIWERSRHHIRYRADGLDPTSKCFLALCGFPIEDRARIGSVSRSALLPYAGLMSLYSNSAAAVSSMLSGFFGILCEILEYAPRKVLLDADSRIALGVSNTRLGRDMILGESVEDDLGKFTVRLGPDRFETVAPFFPGGRRHHEIGELLAMVVSDPLDWDVEYKIERDTISPAVLGGARLGVSCWMGSEQGDYLETPIRLAPFHSAGADAGLEQGAPPERERTGRTNQLEAFT